MVGKTISHYQILEKIGEGGMGVVYKARDTHLKRSVALKVLPPEKVADAERKRRFVQEAESASALNHPNIVTVHDIDQSDGIDFIAMEYVQGKTLGELIGRKGLKLGETLKCGVQIADALSRAHAAGIIHRDLKPGNIMVDEHGLVKVLDFGLAKLTETAPLGEDESTRTLKPTTEEGTIVGTVAYMSPEQAEGKRLDARSDIFSFGAVLYEMVTGHRAFRDDTKASTLGAIIHKEPEPLGAEVPHDLEKVITRCLRKDPARRFHHMDDVKVELEELKGESGSGKLAGLAPARKRRRWVLVSAATVLLVVATGGVGTWAWRTRSQGREPLTSLVILPLENVAKDPGMEYLSEGIAESLINSLSHVRQLRVMARATAFRFKGRQSEPQTVGRELNVRAVLTGRLLQVGDGLVIQMDLVDADNGTQLWGRRYDRKLGDVLEIQDDVAREIANNLRLELTPSERANLLKRYTENTEAYQFYLQGRAYWNRRIGDSLGLAAEQFSRAIQSDPGFALAYSGLADCFNQEMEYLQTRPRDVFPKALAAARKAVELDDELAEGHASLAWTLTTRREFVGAEREFQRALELNPHLPIAHHWYSICLFEMGRSDNALGESERAGELDPLSFQIPAFRGRLLHEIGQDGAAIEVFRKAQQLNPQYPFYSLRLSDVRLEQGRYQEAFEALQQYLKADPSRQHYLLG